MRGATRIPVTKGDMVRGGGEGGVVRGGGYGEKGREMRGQGRYLRSLIFVVN